MAHIPERAIRTACDQIIDCYGPRGKAVEELEKLRGKLTTELESTEEWERQLALRCDLEFLEGYMETPAGKIADIKANQRHIRR